MVLEEKAMSPSQIFHVIYVKYISVFTKRCITNVNNKVLQLILILELHVIKISAKTKSLKADDSNFDDKEEIKCCSSDGQFLPTSLRHDECFPIAIPANDPFHGGKGRRCMEFVRSMPAERPKCNLGPREQVI